MSHDNGAGLGMIACLGLSHGDRLHIKRSEGLVKFYQSLSNSNQRVRSGAAWNTWPRRSQATRTSWKIYAIR